MKKPIKFTGYIYFSDKEFNRVVKVYRSLQELRLQCGEVEENEIIHVLVETF